MTFDLWEALRGTSARDRLARASLTAMAAALFYFVAYGVHQSQLAETRGQQRDKAIATLSKTNEGIIDKLADVFAKTEQAEAAAKAAGVVPQATVQAVKDSLAGYVDPSLIQKAIEKAGIKGPPGPTGAAGPPGPAGAAGGTASTSSSTTTTTRAASTTTSSTTTTTTKPKPKPTTTTTTRPCLVNVPGLAKLGC